MKTKPSTIKEEAWREFRREAKEYLFRGYEKRTSITTIVIYLLTLVSFLMSVFWSYWILIVFVLLLVMTIGGTQTAIRTYNQHLEYLIRNAPDDTMPDGKYTRGSHEDKVWNNININIPENETFVNLRQHFTISSGVKEGDSKFFFANGCCYCSVTYKSGVLDGPQTWFDPNENIVRLQSYVNGELSETAVEYYPGEKKRMIQEGGTFHFFDDKGNLRVKISGDFVLGHFEPVGEWHEYDLKGEICKTYRFTTKEKNGRRFKVCIELTSPIGSDAEEVEWEAWGVDEYQFAPRKFFHRHFQTEGEEEIGRSTGRDLENGSWSRLEYRSWSTRPVVELSDLIRVYNHSYYSK